MTEPEFKKPQLEDKELIRDYFMTRRTRSCERCFANVYLWSRHYPVGFAVIEDTLVFRSSGDIPSYTYPAGTKENTKKALDYLTALCEEQGVPFTMYLVTPEQFEELESFYPGRFQIEYDRDTADYVYEKEKLATLSGKKYHGKRNHINKFKELNPDWSYEQITDDNVEECFQMGLKWRKENGCDDDDGKVAELCVALNSLRLIKELDLRGGLLRVNGEVVAFSIGEPVSDDTLVVHIEKAFADIQGAYPMINQQFVLHEGDGFEYINREEDMGVEGLRKAKESYRPVFLVEKGKVTEKQ